MGAALWQTHLFRGCELRILDSGSSLSPGRTSASAAIHHLGAPHASRIHVPAGFVSTEVYTLLCGPPWLPWILVATRQSRVSGLTGFADFRPSVQLRPFRRPLLINCP